MRVGSQNLGDDVFFLGGHATLALATAILLPEVRLRNAFHVVFGGEQDNALFFWYEFFFGELANFMIDNLATTCVTIFVLHGEEFFLDDAQNLGFGGKNGLEFFDKLMELFQLSFDFVAFEALEAAKLHLQDGLSLNFGKTETRHQLFVGVVIGGADDFDDFVDVIKGDF